MAQSQLYTQKAQIHLVNEATVDTFVAPAGSGTNIFLAENVSVSFDGANYEPNYVRADYLAMDESPGPLSATIGFDIPLKGSGAAGTAPEYAKALGALGFKETIVGATSVTYVPSSVFTAASGAPDQSYSCSFLVNGVRYSVKGAFATGTIRAEAGSPGILHCDVTGAYNAFADDALESPTYNATKAPAFLGATFAVNFGAANTPKGIRNLELTIGNKITIGRDANESNGIYGARIVGRKSTGSFDCEGLLVATYDWYGKQRAGTSGTITTGVVGGTAGNRWALSIGRAILRPIGYENREGILGFTVPFAVSSANTDVEGTNADISLAFT